MIKVVQSKSNDPMLFNVIVQEDSNETHHQVTMSNETYEDLTGGRVNPGRCIEAAFEFLLERESKESILSSFDVTVISRYFPSFASEFGNYISP